MSARRASAIPRERTPIAARRWAELVVLFALVPALLALAPRWAVSVGILSSGIIAAAALALDPTFPRQELIRLRATRRGLRTVLLRTLVVGLALLATVAIAAPRGLFSFPRHRPVVWAIVMVLYPLSAYAQEIVFRPFFFHRYGHLFATPRRRILASGLVFGWAHIVVNNVLAIGLASIGGILFASTYERSRSTMLVSLEHALYGDLAFTVGMGAIFYSTARWF